MNHVKSIRDITIRSVDNGYIITVGCKTFTFGSKAELLQELTTYLTWGIEREIELFGNPAVSLSKIFDDRD